MIDIQHLYKKLGKVEVLKDINLNIDKGGIFAILGPNGSGKSTLIKSILGMVIPNSGDIRINQQSVLQQYEYRKQINYLPQIAHFPGNLTVQELLDMIANIRGEEAHSEDLIQAFSLEPFLNQKTQNLSGGTKQKVNLTLTFMFNGDIVILDEPTSGLDPVSLLELKKIILAAKQNGKTILLCSHIMSFVEEIANEIVFLLDGKIHYKGTLEHLKEQTQQKDLEHAISQLLQPQYA